MSRYVLVRPNRVDIPDWIAIWIDQRVHSFEIVLKGFIPPEESAFYIGRIAGIGLVCNKSGNLSRTTTRKLRNIMIFCAENKEKCIEIGHRGMKGTTTTSMPIDWE